MTGSPFITREYLDSVEQLVYQMCVEYEDEMVRAMIDADGLAYGDVPLSREERILKYIEDQETGVHTVLQVQNPDEFIRRDDEFQRDTRDVGLTDG